MHKFAQIFCADQDSAGDSEGFGPHLTVFLLGANHDTATVAVRECLSIPTERIADALRFLKSSVGDIVLISTCNRTEFYALNPQIAEPALRRFIYDHAKLPPGDLDHALYRLDGDDAIRHLMRVACGLDSMILGEPQVLGQVREAWRTSSQAGTLGPVLDALFRAAINSGKVARARTGISRGAVSVSHAAVEFARERFGNLQDHGVLVVGAGETGALVARNLRSNGAGRIIVANRTIERAGEVAETLGAESISFEQLPEALARVDIVITCTGAPEPVLSRELVEPALVNRDGRALLAIDIAMPRDIAPDVYSLPGISVYDLDALQSRVTANGAERQEAARAVEEVIEQQIFEFQRWYTGHAAGGTIRAVRERAEEIRQAQLERVMKRMSGLDEDDRRAVEIFSEQLVNALLHEPISQLRDPHDGPTNAAYLRALFGVEPGPDEPLETPHDDTHQTVA